MFTLLLASCKGLVTDSTEKSDLPLGSNPPGFTEVDPPGETPPPTHRQPPVSEPSPTNPPPGGTHTNPGDLCPQGELNDRFGTGVNMYGKELRLREGETHRYCAVVAPPLVPAGTQIFRIHFTLSDKPDWPCGRASMEVEQSFSPFLKRGTPDTYSDQSIATFHYRKSGGGYGAPNILMPDNVKHGVYVITVRGGKPGQPTVPQGQVAAPDHCEWFKLAWSWGEDDG